MCAAILASITLINIKHYTNGVDEVEVKSLGV